MSARIAVAPGTTIDVWSSSMGVGVEIIGRDSNVVAFLTAEKTDEFIRALSAARVEISKARPKS